MSGSSSVDPVVLDLYKLGRRAGRPDLRSASDGERLLPDDQHRPAAFVGLLAAATDARKEDLPASDGALLATAGVSQSVADVVAAPPELPRPESLQVQQITEIEKEHLPVMIFEREWEFLKTDEPLPGGRDATPSWGSPSAPSCSSGGVPDARGEC
ncbi:MAG: hypothetical protein R2704_16350 [Microthrixaceae bacterium]